MGHNGSRVGKENSHDIARAILLMNALINRKEGYII